MFWISYSVAFVLASAVAIAFVAIRLALSAVGKAFGLILLLNQRNTVSQRGIISARVARR